MTGGDIMKSRAKPDFVQTIISVSLEHTKNINSAPAVKRYFGQIYVSLLFKRPLMDYINMLANNELYIYKSEELMPNKVEADWNQVENNLRTTYPSTMVIVAKKHE